MSFQNNQQQQQSFQQQFQNNQQQQQQQQSFQQQFQNNQQQQQFQSNQEWQPLNDGLMQILGLYRVLADANETETIRNVHQQITALRQRPDFANYLAYILVYASNEPAAVRQMAGLHLKTMVKQQKLANEVVAYLKSKVVQCLGDGEPTVRATVANIITSIAVQNTLQSWPELLPLLWQLLDSQDLNQLSGALTTINNLSEDIPQQLDDERLNRPLNMIIPKLIGFFLHPKENIRRDALSACNQYLTYMPQALAVNMEQYMQNLFRLTQDGSTEIRKRVCQSMVTLLEIRLDYLLPHMENVIKFMIMSTQDTTDEEVALEACEFWPAYCDTTNTDMDLLKKYLPALVPVLLKGMTYSDLDLASMGVSYDNEDEEDFQEPDRASNIAPRFHTSRTVNFDDGAESSDDEWDDMADWNLRKCSAASMDTLANVYKDHLLQFLLQPLNECLAANSWLVRESGILALGAIADGCYEGIQKFLPNLVPYLIQLLMDKKALVRSITCWTLSRYAKWIMLEADDEKYFKPLMQELLMRIQDRNKKVQEAACSAFATLEEEAQERLLKYLGPILENLMVAFNTYQAKNMLILYDAIGTLAEAVGSALNEPKYINILMPPLMTRWNSLNDDDRNIFPLLECLTSIAQAIKLGFAPFAGPVYGRCLQLIEKTLQQQRQAEQLKQANMDYELPDKEFIVCSLDLLSGLAEGLGASVEQLVSESNTLALLFECAKDGDRDVRQSAFALLGDLAKACIGHLQPHLDKFVPVATENLYPRLISVCNNASWAIGEIAVKVGSQMQPFIPHLMERLVNIMNQQNLMRNLLENTAITIARLGLVCPDAVSQFLPEFAPTWCYYLTGLREDPEKEHAFQGLCLVVSKRPQPIIQCFPVFCTAVAQWNNPNQEIVSMFHQVLHSFKNMLGQQWQAVFSTVDPEVQQHLVNIYKL